ncbi:MAG3090 family protein [Mycoplasmopsis fermentans]|uniref:MAG3090 family protein n=1 Tax=Mycoplasmopsis fermentans TaxID=2115 RepID=UPI000F0259E4|nr:hypothetical protein [Mycoplasmopsis fermentans]RMX35651.1 putative membrane protein [Mycoplasmopsis fermentans MF-I1]RMX35695.1 putative membrane protein [Mycoplasmopsis fermentans MF-I2]
MKRLNCTYEVKKDPIYPWLLKHPKIKIGLAKFKTRQEALEWYMLLKYETAVWYQNDQKIFEGQLTCDCEDGQWSYYIKTAGFDGGGTYEGNCRQIGINPSTFQHDDYDAKRRLRNLDFVLISDPATYFPPELEIAKKKKKSDVVDVDAIRAQFQEQINILLTQIHENNAEADKELELLKQELAKKDMNFNEMARKMELLRQNYKPLEGVTYMNYITLSFDDYVGGVALYTEKIKNIIETTPKQNISEADYNNIKKNYANFNKQLLEVEANPNFPHADLVQKMHAELSTTFESLLSLLVLDPKLEDTPANRGYFLNKETKQKQEISWATSYVLVDLYHVGFVPYEEYEYAIPYLAIRNKFAVTVINESDATKTITIQSAERDAVEMEEAVLAAEKSSKTKKQPKTETIVTEVPPVVEEVKDESVVEAEAVVEEVKPVEKKQPTIKEEPLIVLAPEEAKKEKVEDNDFVLIDHKKAEKPKTRDFAVRVVEEKPIQVIEEKEAQPEDNFYTGIRGNEPVALESEESSNNVSTKKKRSAGFYFLILLLVLILAGLLTLDILAIIQLAGGYTFFNFGA